MTVNTTYKPARANGNGITTAFTFNFDVRDEADLKVYLVTNSTNVKVLQTITTHYTVALNTELDGGTVTWVTPPASGEASLIERSVALLQPTDVPDVGTIIESEIEGEWDNSRIIDQQQQDELDRTFKISTEDDSVLSQMSYTIPTPVANSSLRWASDGNSLENYSPASASELTLPVTNGMIAQTASNTFTSRTIQKTGNIVVTNGDGQSGDPTIDSTTIDNNITQISTDLASTANGDGASLVGVEDSAAYFTGTDVEAVLAELGAVNLTANSTFTATRSSTAATGTVNYAHSLSKTPSKVYVYAKITGLNNYTSVGVCSIIGGTFKNAVTYHDQTSVDFVTDSDGCVGYASDDSIQKQVGKITAADSTNITISWTKTGTPTSQTLDIVFLAEG